MGGKRSQMYRWTWMLGSGASLGLLVSLWGVLSSLDHPGETSAETDEPRPVATASQAGTPTSRTPSRTPVAAPTPHTRTRGS